MKFKAMRGCRRPAREQRYIWALLAAWESLSLDRRAEIRLAISKVCATPAEERALFDVAVRGKNPEAVAARCGVSVRRLYALRCRVYEQIEVR